MLVLGRMGSEAYSPGERRVGADGSPDRTKSGAPQRWGEGTYPPGPKSRPLVLPISVTTHYKRRWGEQPVGGPVTTHLNPKVSARFLE